MRERVETVGQRCREGLERPPRAGPVLGPSSTPWTRQTQPGPSRAPPSASHAHARTAYPAPRTPTSFSRTRTRAHARSDWREGTHPLATVTAMGPGAGLRPANALPNGGGYRHDRGDTGRRPSFRLASACRSAHKWAAARRPTCQHPLLVVPHTRLVVGEEHLPHQVPAATDAGFLEDALEVLLDRVG